MTATDTLLAIEAIVRPHLRLLDADADLTTETKLGEAGLDSMASIDLLLDLEEKFDISIQDERITENSFDSILEISKLVEESRGD